MTAAPDIPIFDGHNDAVQKIAPFGPADIQRFLDGGTSGHIDLPGALKGGLHGGLFAIFVPSPKQPDMPDDPELGILVDVSHLNEQGFWDVAWIRKAPLVASHSAAHAICSVTRNLTDRQLAAIRDSDGLVGMNFEASATRADGHDNPDTPIEVIVAGIEYLVELIGGDRVGFGSDFDGATMPAAIGDAAGLPVLIDALRKRDYDHASLAKLAYRNWLCVLRATWKTS